DRPVAQVADQRKHLPDRARRDALDQPQRQVGVVDRRGLGALHSVLEVIRDLVGLVDVVGRAARAIGDLDQQVLVPVLADPQRGDWYPAPAGIVGLDQALLLVLGLTIGQQHQTADGVRPTFIDLAQALLDRRGDLGAARVADLADLLLRLAT